VNYAGQAVRGVDVARPADDTITAKSLRIDEKAHVLRERLREIESRSTRPVPETAENAKAPIPSHAVFALQEAEECLEECIHLAESVLGAL